jgi:hypothetical protein
MGKPSHPPTPSTLSAHPNTLNASIVAYLSNRVPKHLIAELKTHLTFDTNSEHLDLLNIISEHQSRTSTNKVDATGINTNIIPVKENIKSSSHSDSETSETDREEVKEVTKKPVVPKKELLVASKDIKMKPVADELTKKTVVTKKPVIVASKDIKMKPVADKRKGESSSDSDSSSSESDDEEVTKKAVVAKKAAVVNSKDIKTKGESSSDSDSSSSESDDEEVKEVTNKAAVTKKAAAVNIKAIDIKPSVEIKKGSKAESSSDSDSSSSESENETVKEVAKKPVGANTPKNGKQEVSSSDSESDNESNNKLIVQDELSSCKTAVEPISTTGNDSIKNGGKRTLEESNEEQPPTKKLRSDVANRFQRIKVEEVTFAKPELNDNTFMSKGGSVGSYGFLNLTIGHKAHQDLIVTRGKGFRKEKDKVTLFVLF